MRFTLAITSNDPDKYKPASYPIDVDIQMDVAGRETLRGAVRDVEQKENVTVTKIVRNSTGKEVSL